MSLLRRLLLAYRNRFAACRPVGYRRLTKWQRRVQRLRCAVRDNALTLAVVVAHFVWLWCLWVEVAGVK